MNVFISYQRSDTAMAAHALGYALRLGKHEPFVDTGSVGAGEQFRQSITHFVAQSQVMLVLFGPSFDATRLHEPTSVLTYEWQRARFHGIGVAPVLVERAALPSDDQLPLHLRWLRQHNQLALRRDSLAADIERCVAAIPALARTPRRAARVLWVDDKPSNNEKEREYLRPHGIVFDCVVSNKEAQAQLENESYDLVITDLGRKSSSDRSSTAGAAFLDLPIVRDGGQPVIVYAGRWAVAQRDALRARGALDVMDGREQLYKTVLDVLGRGTPPPGDLQR